MGSITETKRVDRASGKTVTVFRAYVRRTGFASKSKVCLTRTEAKQWLRENEAAASLRRSDTWVGKKLSTVIDEFVEAPPARGMRYWSAGHLDFWREQLGHVYVADISRSHINAAKSALQARAALRSTPNGPKVTADKLTPATVNRYLASLSSVFIEPEVRLARAEWRLERRSLARDVGDGLAARLRQPGGCRGPDGRLRRRQLVPGRAMTTIALTATDDRVLVAVDSLTRDLRGEVIEASKLIVIPHLSFVVAGRGSLAITHMAGASLVAAQSMGEAVAAFDETLPHIQAQVQANHLRLFADEGCPEWVWNPAREQVVLLVCAAPDGS